MGFLGGREAGEGVRKGERVRKWKGVKGRLFVLLRDGEI